jgi:hypothetical protein
MLQLKKQYKGKYTKLVGVPFAIEETLPMHPSFEKFCKVFPQILDYFEPIPKPKKKVDEGAA